MYKDKGGEPSPYNNDSEEARRVKNAVETIRRSGCENFKYFDLIDYIPPERHGGAIGNLQVEDYVKAAIEVRSFLLE